ncbi:MAG: glycosyltransferase [Ignavibacteriales bacterium]|nr:glycosyltransferase [Ignavibacteriales bacterium]
MASERVVFDMVILEALVCEIPILASKNGGNIEIIQNNNNGVFLKNWMNMRLLTKLLK